MPDPYATNSVSIALIRNPDAEILWVWDDEWGCFALPMTRPKAGTSDMEQAPHAARRAGAKALGVPVRVGQSVQLEPELFVSRRDYSMRRYRYDVYRVEPHPDFAKALAISRPYLWLAPHRALSGDYEPLSDSCRWVINGLIHQRFLPGRSQYTGVLVLQREHNGKRQFLLRHEPAWGYALPTKRRQQGESYAAAAQRTAHDELGLGPAAIDLKPAGESVVTTREKSQSEQTDTYYCHGVFEASPPHSTKFVSSRPLVWADARTILAGRIHDQLSTDGQKAPEDRVSPTAIHVLQELDHIPFIYPDLVNS